MVGDYLSFIAHSFFRIITLLNRRIPGVLANGKEILTLEKVPKYMGERNAGRIVGIRRDRHKWRIYMYRENERIA